MQQFVAALLIWLSLIGVLVAIVAGMVLNPGLTLAISVGAFVAAALWGLSWEIARECCT